MRPAMYGAYHHITVLGKENAPCDHKYDAVSYTHLDVYKRQLGWDAGQHCTAVLGATAASEAVSTGLMALFRCV